MQVFMETMDRAVKKMSDRQGKYLTFSLAGDEYGIGIPNIREIMAMETFTPVIQAPFFLKGEINLRGRMIPVVDLRVRFGMEPVGYTERTGVIFVETPGETGTVMTGIVVDSVSEVLKIGTGDIGNPSAWEGGLKTDYILGVANVDGGETILLDIDRVLTPGEGLHMR